MTNCPTCGSGQWSYDSTTVTCKHGHRFGPDGKAVPVQPPWEGVAETASPRAIVRRHAPSLVVAAAAGSAAAVVVEVLARIAG